MLDADTPAVLLDCDWLNPVMRLLAASTKMVCCTARVSLVPTTGASKSLATAINSLAPTRFELLS